MTASLLIVLALVVVGTVLFVTEVVSFDVTALIITGTLLLSGVLEPHEALAGLSNEATVTIACMLVLTAGLQETGVINRIAQLLEEFSRRSSNIVATVVILVIVGLASGFMNNTAVVVIFIPVMMRLASKLGRSVSSLLMPISFISIFGGACTLIGTSTNLLVSSIAEEGGQEPLSMFELTPVGAILLVVGLLYLLTIGRRLVPNRRSDNELTREFEVGNYLTEVEVPPGSHIVETDTDPIALTRGLDLDVLEIFRHGEALTEAVTTWQVGDRIRLRGSASEISRLLDREDLRLRTQANLGDDAMAEGDKVLVEVVLAPDTALIGQPLGKASFAERFGATPLALRHLSELHRTNIEEHVLRAGDSLLLLVTRGRVGELNRSPMFVVASEVMGPLFRRRRGPLAIVIIVAVVLPAALGLVPIVVSALLGVLAMVLSRCLSSEEAYLSVNWKVIILLAGIMPLGVAMDKTGAASLIADGVLAVLQPMGPHAVLAGFLLLTIASTNVMSNIAAAALLCPVAMQAAATMGIDGRPLLVAITFGASLSFLTPIGYQTNTLIYQPGNYRFGDFFRVGGPLTAITVAIVVVLVPVFWPF